ncbi:MAG: Mrp/NBP35 family ATP-binding protein [Candidatus Cloacimonetes bacterium]|nr:Mrp/NBP35 family ATP-binding protein [Candidatus Cloacimonadota bacterium]
MADIQQDQQKKKELYEKNLHNIKHIIVVMSGKGGVGKSTVAVNLAYALAGKGNMVGILDTDIHGPSIVKMTGTENKKLMAQEGQSPTPVKVTDNLVVLSIASLLQDPDAPVIWRGPMKMNLIKQFMEDIAWPELDYLIVDCPPGTGDEPLSVIQILKNITGVVIVSTPQEIAYLDVRKAINFAKKLEIPILGIVENMTEIVCPHCGQHIELFKPGSGEKALKDFSIDLLGRIPFDVQVVLSGDTGTPFIQNFANSEAGKRFNEVANNIEKKLS